jgi:hypothetical protein
MTNSEIPRFFRELPATRAIAGAIAEHCKHHRPLLTGASFVRLAILSKERLDLFTFCCSDQKRIDGRPSGEIRVQELPNLCVEPVDVIESVALVAPDTFFEKGFRIVRWIKLANRSGRAGSATREERLARDLVEMGVKSGVSDSSALTERRTYEIYLKAKVPRSDRESVTSIKVGFMQAQTRSTTQITQFNIRYRTGDHAERIAECWIAVMSTFEPMTRKSRGN